MDTGTAGPIARPPLLCLSALLAGFVLDRLLRLPFPYLDYKARVRRWL